MEPEPATLCTFCAGLVQPREKPSKAAIRHHANLGLLEESSKSCQICRVILGNWSLSTLQNHFPDVDTDMETYKSVILEVTLEEEPRVSSALSWLLLRTNCYIRGFAIVHNFSITVCDAESTHATQPIWRNSTTSTHERISLVKSWLERCERHHPNCKPNVSRMPRRLIDVGSLDGYPRPPRLIMFSEFQDITDIRYSTLTYCWGNTNFCTTRESEKEHRQEIPYHLLPATMQDAITLTRQLRIPFLWIDALCIVQDDPVEWEEEASKMQDIYSGSSFTIAAADAVGGSAGYFASDLESGHNLDNLSAFLTYSGVRGNGKFLIRAQRSDIRAYAENSVVNTRGWVLQEIVLSHRIVYWMASGLYWECRSESQTESGLKFERSMMPYGSIPILPQNIEASANRIWWEWMKSYSRRSFTFPKDRLPALSGITRHYQMATKDIPILGLWESSFHQDLLWMRVERMSESDDRASRRLPNMPSWTWLSCPYHIEYDFWDSVDRDPNQIQDHVKLIDWEIIWTSEPLLSDVKFTRLILDGPVREIVLSVAPKAKTQNPPYLDADDDEELDFEKHPFPWKYAGQFDNGHRFVPTRYLCLLVRTRIYKKRRPFGVKENFLILEPCLVENVYRRVGIGHRRGEKESFDHNMRRTLILV